MSGKGGSSNTSSTVTNQPPKEFLDAYKGLLSRATTVANQPLQQYQGPMLAGFTADQNAGMNLARDSVGIASPFINAASSAYGASTAPIWDQQQQFSPDAINQYMSPYMNDVVDATQRDFNTSNQIAQQGIIGNAISKGAWGGDRASVAQALTAGEQARAQAPVIAGLRSQGYTQGVDQFNKQQQAKIAADEANAWLNAQAGTGFANLGTMASSQALQGANTLMGIGGQQQQLAQQALNIPYEQFLQQQAYPFQTTGWLGGITGNLGSGSGGTSTTTTPGASPVSSILGSTATGAGIGGSVGGGYGALIGGGLGLGAGILGSLFHRGGAVRAYGNGGGIVGFRRGYADGGGLAGMSYNDLAQMLDQTDPATDEYGMILQAMRAKFVAPAVGNNMARSLGQPAIPSGWNRDPSIRPTQRWFPAGEAPPVPTWTPDQTPYDPRFQDAPYPEVAKPASPWSGVITRPAQAVLDYLKDDPGSRPRVAPSSDQTPSFNPPPDPAVVPARDQGPSFNPPPDPAVVPARVGPPTRIVPEDGAGIVPRRSTMPAAAGTEVEDAGTPKALPAAAAGDMGDEAGSLRAMAPWMALIQGGAAMMASKNPRVMGALGEGVGAGASSFLNTRKQAGDEAYRKRKLDLDAEDLSQRARDTAARLKQTGQYQQDTIEARQRDADIREQQAQQGRWTYVGPDADNPGHTIWADSRTGATESRKVNVGAKASSRSAAVTKYTIAQDMVKAGEAPDVPAALARINDPSGKYSGQVKVAIERLAQGAAKAGMSPEDLKAWREEYTGVIGAPATVASNAPKAAAPAEPGSKADRIQRGLPVGSEYSPSRRQWRTPDGKIVGP